MKIHLINLICCLATHVFAGEASQKLIAYPDSTTRLLQATELKTGSESVSLLDGKLTISVPADFEREPADKADPKTIAKFSRAGGAWGEVLRGTHGLTPDKLEDYLKMRVAE